jgi:hypothetical protein
MLPKVSLLLDLWVVLFSASRGPSSAVPALDNACAVVPDGLKEMDGLKPGDARDQLDGSFALEGGLQSRSKSGYAFKKCRHIKVDVEFSEEGNGDRTDFLAKDRIVKMSRL